MSDAASPQAVREAIERLRLALRGVPAVSPAAGAYRAALARREAELRALVEPGTSTGGRGW